MLATLKRAQNELSSYQRKVFKVDDHMGIAISGLTADGRVLCKYMRNECLNYRWLGGAFFWVGSGMAAVRLFAARCWGVTAPHEQKQSNNSRPTSNLRGSLQQP